MDYVVADDDDGDGERIYYQMVALGSHLGL
jgi:hypothetical protein